jgi:hypothetical protein
MYKKASANQQGRTDRAINVSHHNEHGIDPSAFEMCDADKDEETIRNIQLQRANLLERKRQLEQKNVYFTRQLQDARAAYHGDKDEALDYPQFIKIREEKEAIVSEMKDIEQQLSRFRLQLQGIAHSQNQRRRIIKREQVEFGSYEKIFVQIAQQMLAKPVFERIALATVHRLQEQRHEIKSSE